MSEQLRSLLDLPLSSSVDPVFGPVYQLFELTCPPEGFQIHTVVAKGPNVENFMGLQYQVSGIGYHRNLAKAANMAVGECLERLALFPINHPAQVRHSSVDDATSLDIRSFIHNQDVRNLIKKYAYPSIEGMDLISNIPVLIPADICSFGTSSTPQAQSEPIPFCTSTGAAIHSNREDALTSALKELIERDLFMLTWYTRTKFPIAHFDKGTRVGRYIEEICCTGAPIPQLVDLSMPYGIPAVVCVVLDQNSYRYGIGASVGATIDEAAIAAISEAAAVYNSDPSRYVHFPQAATDIASFDDHVWWYQSGAGHRSEFDWLVSSEKHSDGPWSDFRHLSSAEFTNHMLTALEASGAQVFAVPLAEDFLAQLGLYAFHTLSPQTCDLDVYHRYPGVDNARIRSEWAKTYFEQPEELNLAPHPFP